MNPAGPSFGILIAGLLGGLAGTLPGLAIILLAIHKTRRRKRLYADLRAEHAASAKGAVVLDARYSSERRYKSVFKFFPWEMAGILIVRENEIAAHLSSENRKLQTSMVFHSSTHLIEWKGSAEYWHNGFWSWFVIIGPSGERHYFTSETGAVVFGSRKRSAALLEALQTTLRLTRCKKCDYVLWGNTTGICPECGTAFTRPEGEAGGSALPSAHVIESPRL